MKQLIRTILLLALFGMGITPALAQQPLVRENISPGCNTFKLYIDSDYGATLTIAVRLGTGNGVYDLYDMGGVEFRVAANGVGTAFYDIPDLAQKTRIYFEIIAQDANTLTTIRTIVGSRECEGFIIDVPPAPAQTSTTPVDNAAAQLVSTACDASGTLTVTPLNGGAGLSVSAQQRTQALLTAQLAGQNQLIASNGVLAIYALTPAEIQVNIAGTDAQYPVNICGALSFNTATSPTPTATTFGPVAAPAVSGSCTVSGSQQHIVQRGENLFRIGLRYGIGFRELAAYNNIPDPTRIYAGQCIAIP